MVCYFPCYAGKRTLVAEMVTDIEKIENALNVVVEKKILKRLN